MVTAEASLWSFSLRVYGTPSVADACLELQDSGGLDVNVLLFCLWAGLTRGELDGALMAEVEAVSSEWSSRVTTRLRAVRRALASTGYEELRAEVQRVELAAEKVEQEQLEKLARRSPALDLAPAAARRSARLNLARYLDAAGVACDSLVEARLATLIDAAMSRG